MKGDLKRWNGQIAMQILGDFEFENFLARRSFLWSWAVLWTRAGGGWLLKIMFSDGQQNWQDKYKYKYKYKYKDKDDKQ